MTYFIYLLSALWSIGCIGLVVWCVVWLFDEEGPLIAFFIGCVALPIGVLLAVLPWAAIEDASSPDLVTLKKNAWFCSASHTVVTTTMVASGKVMVPVTTSHQVCDRYDRR